MKLALLTLIISISLTTYGQKGFPFHKGKNSYFVSTDLKQLNKGKFKAITPAELNYFYVLKNNHIALADLRGQTKIKLSKFKPGFCMLASNKLLSFYTPSFKTVDF
jgi:hypothetical protein